MPFPKGNSLLFHGRFRWDFRENFCLEKVTRHWKGLPGKGWSPHPWKWSRKLDVALCAMVWMTRGCLVKDWTWSWRPFPTLNILWIFKIHSWSSAISNPSNTPLSCCFNSLPHSPVQEKSFSICNESKHKEKRAWGCQTFPLTLYPFSNTELSMCWSAACSFCASLPWTQTLLWLPEALQGSVLNHLPSTEGNNYYFTNTLFAIQESPGCFASPIEPIPTHIANFCLWFLRRCSEVLQMRMITGNFTRRQFHAI